MTMKDALGITKPDVLIHMAAQPLVRESFAHPRQTVETNVMGTLNVLEAAGTCDTLRGALIVTTDKVYRNVGRQSGYVEDEPLGGDDPYSASKAMADLLTHAWLASFPGPPTAVVRAGNVIGGGDYSQDRLVPDAIKALSRGDQVLLRFPGSIRPWQHVLDCLNGYLAVTQHALSSSTRNAGVWNIGPGNGGLVSVSEVTAALGRLWGNENCWSVAEGEHPDEAGLLALDASKARHELGWDNILSLESAVEWTADWYLRVARGEPPLDVTLDQVTAFMPQVTSFGT